MEDRKEVTVFQTKFYCPSCHKMGNSIELKMNSAVCACYPPMFDYKCPKCGYKKCSSKEYPEISYVLK